MATNGECNDSVMHMRHASVCSDQVHLREASRPTEVGSRLAVVVVYASSSSLRALSCQPDRRKEESRQRCEVDSLSTSSEEKCLPAAGFYDDLQRDDSGARESEPFCMAETTKESSSGFLKEDYFVLRLKLRIRSSSNESVTFVTKERTVVCEVSVGNAHPNRCVTDGRC